MLKTLDIVVLSGLIVHPDRRSWTQAQLAERLGISQPSVHRSLGQLERSSLLRSGRPQLSAFRDLVVDGVRYVYPAELGAPARGLATAQSGPGLGGALATAEVFVWPFERGTSQGTALQPLHPAVPAVAEDDQAFYVLMSLIDVFRVGRARELRLAQERLDELLGLRR